MTSLDVCCRKETRAPTRRSLSHDAVGLEQRSGLPMEFVGGGPWPEDIMLERGNGGGGRRCGREEKRREGRQEAKGREHGVGERSGSDLGGCG